MRVGVAAVGLAVNDSPDEVVKNQPTKLTIATPVTKPNTNPICGVLPSKNPTLVFVGDSYIRIF